MGFLSNDRSSIHGFYYSISVPPNLKQMFLLSKAIYICPTLCYSKSSNLIYCKNNYHVLILPDRNRRQVSYKNLVVLRQLRTINSWMEIGIYWICRKKNILYKFSKKLRHPPIFVFSSVFFYLPIFSYRIKFLKIMNSTAFVIYR